MRTLGVWLVVFAIGSYVLPMVGLQFILLAWISSWGPTTALVIQIAMLTLGILLIVGGSRVRRGRSVQAPPPSAPG